MQATPFLMFQGQARDALDLYRRAFPDLEVLSLRDHQLEGMEGQIALARIRFGGSEWFINDSPPVHAFTFTPSSSQFIECDDEAHLRRLADILGEGGAVMMDIADYGFSRLFTWLADRFGVSWQLNLA